MLSFVLLLMRLVDVDEPLVRSSGCISTILMGMFVRFECRLWTLRRGPVRTSYSSPSVGRLCL